nr:retrovirus-related Pol polyprotein from transposon TNT 1-94 [Tanacetum cinerariifolium]
EPTPQEFNTGFTKDQPIEEASQHPDWFQKLAKPLTPDHDWNKTLPAAHGPIQLWISNLARKDDSRDLFNELMDIPLDFLAFMMNRIKVDTLTPELLDGPTFELIKGSCKSLKLAKPLTPDRDWNKTLPAAQGPIQLWISNLARKDDARDSFNELMDIPLDFLAFMMNRIKVDTLTPELLDVERRNQTLVEAARTMLIFSRAPLSLWAEVIATACFTQNRSIIHHRFNKTPYELINGKKPNISFLHVFGALFYPKNDREDIGKLGAKGDIGFFIGYSTDSCAYRVYNRRTKKIMETMNVSFNEPSAMAFEQRSLKPSFKV